MFDAMSLEEATCDLFDVGIRDDNLCLLYNANKDIKMLVKTPYGLTESQTIYFSILQGDTWGPSCVSVQVDTIGRDALDAGIGYSYKQEVELGILGMVDDMAGVTEAGHMAQVMNQFINVKSAEKTITIWIRQMQNYAYW